VITLGAGESFLVPTQTTVRSPGKRGQLFLRAGGVDWSVVLRWSFYDFHRRIRSSVAGPERAP
jgi:hypothetical protein